MEDRYPQIRFKTETETFNHALEFALREGRIWVRRRDEQGACWHPMPFDHRKRRPVSLHADGANLIVVNELGQIHYRKVLDETRAEGRYSCRDISSKYRWYPRWFSLPGASQLTRLFRPDRLRVPRGARSVKVSHRGLYNHGFEDALGTVHHEIGGSTTTVVMLDQNGQDLHLFDPWCPDYVPAVIPLPDGFKAQKMDVSGGCIALLGYQYRGEAKLTLYTLMADFDILGWNPIHRCGYAGLENRPGARILHPNPWREHSLPDGVGDQLTIFQTGELNGARELVLSTRTGVIHKEIDDEVWHASLTPPPHGEPLPIEEPPESREASWNGDGLEMERFYPGMLTAKCNYRGVPLLAYRRDNLLVGALIGKGRTTYDLVYTDGPMPTVLRQAWKGRSRVNVCFHVHAGGLLCRPTGIDRFIRRISFEWFLKRCNLETPEASSDPLAEDRDQIPVYVRGRAP